MFEFVAENRWPLGVAFFVAVFIFVPMLTSKPEYRTGYNPHAAKWEGINGTSFHSDSRVKDHYRGNAYAFTSRPNPSDPAGMHEYVCLPPRERAPWGGDK